MAKSEKIESHIDQNRGGWTVRPPRSISRTRRPLKYRSPDDDKSACKLRNAHGVSKQAHVKETKKKTHENPWINKRIDPAVLRKPVVLQTDEMKLSLLHSLKRHVAHPPQSKEVKVKPRNPIAGLGLRLSRIIVMFGDAF
jgi:hypothetical protein